MTATFSGKISSAESNRSFALERENITEPESGWEAAPEVALTQSRLLRTVSCQVLNVCRGGDTTTSPGSLLQHSATLTVRTLLLTWNSVAFPVCQFVHAASCSFTGHHRTEFGRGFFTSPQVFTHMGEIPPSPLFSRLNSHGSNLAVS